MASGAAARLTTLDESLIVNAYAYACQPWLVCFSAALFFFFEYLQLNMFNALDPELMKAFRIGAVQLGNLSAHYFYANVLFMFPAGMILDRVSTRRAILSAMGASVLGVFGFSAAHALWQAEVCRFVTGISGAFCFLSCVRLASRWFPAKRLALVVGLIVTFAMTGGMVAQTPVTLMVDHFGWRATLLIDGGFGFVLLVIMVVFIQDYPRGLGEAFQAQHSELKEMGFWRAMWRTLGNTQNWLAGCYTGFLNLPVFLLGALWGSLYLVQVHGLTRAQSSAVVSMLFVGVILGSPLVGWLSDRLRQRRRPMIVGAFLSLVIMLFLIYAPHLSLFALLMIFLMLGLAISAQIISYPLIAESNSLSLTGTAEGWASVLIMSGGFMQPLFAALMNWNWDHRSVHNMPIYALHDYRLALAVMPIAMGVALIMAFFVRETHCVPCKVNNTF